MSITYLPDQSISSNTQLAIVFRRDDGTSHNDSVVIPYTDGGEIDGVELESRIQSLYNYVINKQNSIDWY